MPKMSIIVPCYNQEKYIAECLDSILAQTFDDYEVIVVNDGSTDNSSGIIDQYAKQYKNIKVINQSNQGVVIARNNAISQAKGIYIFPLDGDDKIAPKCLEKILEAMLSNKGDVIYSDGEYFGSKTGKIEALAPTKYNMCLCNRVISSALYRKTDWEKYGGYDTIMDKGLEDWEFWLNFVEDNKRFYKVEDSLFFYRILETSRNKSISKNTEIELHQIARKKHKKLFGWRFLARILAIKIGKIIFQKKITKSNKLQIKIFKIPVIRLSINKRPNAIKV